jgi:hypothetical protein
MKDFKTPEWWNNNQKRRNTARNGTSKWDPVALTINFATRPHLAVPPRKSQTIKSRNNFGNVKMPTNNEIKKNTMNIARNGTSKWDPVAPTLNFATKPHLAVPPRNKSQTKWRNNFGNAKMPMNNEIKKNTMNIARNGTSKWAPVTPTLNFATKPHLAVPPRKSQTKSRNGGSNSLNFGNADICYFHFFTFWKY